MADETEESNEDEPTFIEWFQANYPEQWQRAKDELKAQYGIDLDKPSLNRRKRRK